MSEPDNSPSSAKPRSVGRFEFLAYLSLVLLICMFAVVSEPSHDPETPQWQTFAPVLLIYVLGRVVLIFAAARRQQNWARWLYGAFVVLDVVIVLLPPYDNQLAPFDIFLVFFVFADIAAVYFAFSRESAAWFHPQRLAASSPGS
jgi:peptidoglycan/LPS O-acetylase OafA/YrhL